MEPTPVVVTPLDEHMGLDIARSLGRRGIPVYGIDSDASVVGRHSRFIRFVLGPEPVTRNGTDYVQFLVEFGKRLGRKAVLFPLSDEHVLVCSEHRAILQQYYDYVMPEHDTVVRLATKDGLESAAREFGIPAPRSTRIDPNEPIESLAGQIAYPVILKPADSSYWHAPEITKLLRPGLLDGRAKVVLCRAPDELIRAYRRIAAYDDRMIVQEVIPGEDNRLAYMAFYLDRDSRPLAIFAGRKYRVMPVGFGSATYVRSMHDAELAETALRLLQAAHYRGLGGIEFKKDPRDECYKLIEVNVRFGMWDGLSVRCGLDLPYIAYRDALHQPVEPQSAYRDDVIWVDWQRDVRAALTYHRRGELSWSAWRASWRGEKMFAIYARDDWQPGLAFTGVLLARLLERAVRQ